jgi:thymidine kinase
MAKLVFNYSAMNAGKTSRLLQVAHSYNATGKKVACLMPNINPRFGESKGVIKSRIGFEAPAIIIEKNANVESLSDNWEQYDIVLVDEAQFLSVEQIEQLSNIVDFHNVTVLAYGLRIDSNGNLFEGSQALFECADVLDEIQGVCSHHGCSRRATHVLRVNADGKVVKNGEQIHIGAEDSYHSVCRKHWKLNEYK